MPTGYSPLTPYLLLNKFILLPVNGGKLLGDGKQCRYCSDVYIVCSGPSVRIRREGTLIRSIINPINNHPGSAPEKKKRVEKGSIKKRKKLRRKKKNKLQSYYHMIRNALIEFADNADPDQPAHERRMI